MPKAETTAGAIARLIRCAFVKANAGESEEALSLWEKAIKLGYDPHPKTEKGLVLAIKKGRSDRGLDDTL